MLSLLTPGLRAELRAIAKLLNAPPKTADAHAVQSVARAMAVLGPRRWRENLAVSAEDVETFNRLLGRVEGPGLFYCDSSLTGLFHDDHPSPDIAAAAAALLRQMLRGASRFQVGFCAHARCRRGPQGTRGLVLGEAGEKSFCSPVCKRG